MEQNMLTPNRVSRATAAALDCRYA